MSTGTFIEEYDALSARISALYDVAQAKGATAAMPAVRDTYGLSTYINSIPSYSHVSDYVQDGLILCWDGIENAGAGIHAEQISGIYDHSGNGYTGTFLSATVFNNGVQLSGVGAMIQALSADLVLSALENQEMTVELLAQRKDWGFDRRYSLWATNDGNGSYNWTFVRTYQQSESTPYRAMWKKEYIDISSDVMIGRGTMSTMTSVGKPKEFKQYANGILGLTYSQDNTTPNNGQACFRVGGGFGGTNDKPMVGFNFHCVRVYNRALSSDEIAYNRAVDVARFNIQTQISAMA